MKQMPALKNPNESITCYAQTMYGKVLILYEYKKKDQNTIPYLAIFENDNEKWEMYCKDVVLGINLEVYFSEVYYPNIKVVKSSLKDLLSDVRSL